jgi:hypothetical protein
MAISKRPLMLCLLIAGCTSTQPAQKTGTEMVQDSYAHWSDANAAAKLQADGVIYVLLSDKKPHHAKLGDLRWDPTTTKATWTPTSGAAVEWSVALSGLAPQKLDEANRLAYEHWLGKSVGVPAEQTHGGGVISGSDCHCCGLCQDPTDGTWYCCDLVCGDQCYPGPYDPCTDGCNYNACPEECD